MAGHIGQRLPISVRVLRIVEVACVLQLVVGRQFHRAMRNRKQNMSGNFDSLTYRFAQIAYFPGKRCRKGDEFVFNAIVVNIGCCRHPYLPQGAGVCEADIMLASFFRIEVMVAKHIVISLVEGRETECHSRHPP